MTEVGPDLVTLRCKCGRNVGTIYDPGGGFLYVDLTDVSSERRKQEPDLIGQRWPLEDAPPLLHANCRKHGRVMFDRAVLERAVHDRTENVTGTQ